MNKKIVIFSAVSFLGLIALVGASSAFAHGMGRIGGFGFGFMMNNLAPEQIASGHQEMFQREARILGISVDDLKAAWAQGKSFEQIIQERNLNRNDIQTRMKEEKVSQMKSNLQVLVDRGVITQAQADQRLQAMQNMMDQGLRGNGMKIKKGFRGGMHF